MFRLHRGRQINKQKEEEEEAEGLSGQEEEEEEDSTPIAKFESAETVLRDRFMAKWVGKRSSLGKSSAPKSPVFSFNEVDARMIEKKIEAESRRSLGLLGRALGPKILSRRMAYRQAKPTRALPVNVKKVRPGLFVTYHNLMAQDCVDKIIGSWPA